MLMGYGFEGAVGWSGFGFGINTLIAVLIGVAAVWAFNAVFASQKSNGQQETTSNYEHHYAK